MQEDIWEWKLSRQIKEGNAMEDMYTRQGQRQV